MRDACAVLRDNTVASLIRYNTIAADRVQAEQVDNTATGDTPRLVVYADHTAQSNALSGTAPRFEVTVQLVVQGLIQAARLADAVDRLDTLVAQIKDGLFCDPDWTSQPITLASYRVVCTYKDEATLITGDCRVLITGTWYEAYNPRLNTRLAGLNITEYPGGVADPVPVAVTVDFPSS